MHKKSKSALQFILAGFMLVSVADISCNSESKTDSKTDTTKMETKPAMDTMAPKMDTTAKMDTASTRPIVPANKQ